MNLKQIDSIINRNLTRIEHEGLPKHALAAMIEPILATGGMPKAKGQIAVAIGKGGLEIVEAVMYAIEHSKQMPLFIPAETYVSNIRETIRENALHEASARYDDAISYVKASEDFNSNECEDEVSMIFHAEDKEDEETENRIRQ